MSNDTTPPHGNDADAAERAAQAIWVRSAALSAILFLMVLYTLYFAASLTMPIALAFLLNLILSPAVRLMSTLRIPRALGALLLMVSVAGITALALYALATPAAERIERAPAELRSLEARLAWVREPMDRINETREQVDELIGGEQESGSQRPEQTASFSIVDAVMRRTPSLMLGMAVMLVLLFFLLASGDAFLNKMVQVTPSLKDKKRVVETAREIQRHVSTYLGTITVINICLGVVAGLAMYLLGMPNPALWGVMVGLLNYIPYIGVFTSVLVVTFVSLLTFDSPGQALLPPLTILVINIIEGQFLTPVLAGRRLSLSPVAVFLSIVVLGWIWGVVGALIAVPTLSTIKLVCESIEPLEPIATFLSR